MFSDFQDFINSQTFIWIIAIVVFLIIEAFTLGLTTIWFAGGALVASFLSLVNDNMMFQILVFLIISLVCLFFVRPLAKTKFNNRLTMTNIDAIVGSLGRAMTDISQEKSGTVRADNKDWTAILADGTGNISKGDAVSIVKVQGVKLIVEKSK